VWVKQAQKKIRRRGRIFLRKKVVGWGLNACRCVTLVSLGHHKAEADFATLGCGTSLALEAFRWGFMGAQTTDFFKNAFHLEFGFQAFESAVNWLSFADLNIWHNELAVRLK
jgi:hypothetical protein